MDKRALVALVERDTTVMNETKLCQKIADQLPCDIYMKTDCSKCIASGGTDAAKVIKWIKDL